MLSFVWWIATIVFVIVLLFVLRLLSIDGTDIMYAMLSGSVVGMLASVVVFSRGAKPHCAVFVVFAAIVASSVSWLLALLLVKLTKVNLLGISALALDLTMGIVGAVAISYFLVGYNAMLTRGE